jgi:hypothetical protein
MPFSLRRRVLVLYCAARSEPLRLAIHQHLRVLDYCDDKYDVLYCNATDSAPGWMRLLGLHAIVFHTTFLAMRWSPEFELWKWTMRWIRNVPCLKIAMPQDEYDHNERLDEWLFEMRADVVFTIFDERPRATLYPIMSRAATFVRCLTGYIDDASAARWVASLQPTDKRELDIVYRASRLPYWFGRQGQLKHRIGDVVLAEAARKGLRCDISTRRQDTIFGDRWMAFLASGRAVIGCESGSDVLDRRGEIRSLIEQRLREDPTLSFEDISACMPAGWDSHRFYALSPRHLEAVVTKTCQILVEGEYSGVLRPHEHYLPVKRDFSNLEDALAALQDTRRIEEIVERAHRDLYASGMYSYRKLASELDRLIGTVPKRSAMDEIATRPLWHAKETGLLLARLAARTRSELVSGCLFVTSISLRKLLGNGFMGLAHILTTSPLRHLLTHYLRLHPGSATNALAEIVPDLLRLSMIGCARRSANNTSTGSDKFPFRLQASWIPERGMLKFVSVRSGEDRAEASGGEVSREMVPSMLRATLGSGVLRSIEWDHSACGTTVPFAVKGMVVGGLSLGEQGVHRFPALNLLAQCRPDELAEALCAILASSSGVHEFRDYDLS